MIEPRLHPIQSYDDWLKRLTGDSWLCTPADMAAHLTQGKFAIPPHLDLLSDKLADMASRGNGRLIVTMPPRHGKSNLVSRWFPVWLLACDPSRRVMLASYEANFAASWGRRTRNDMVEHYDKLGIRIAGDSAAANRWETQFGGGMVTAGAGGAITGKGADFLLIDDVLKNAEEADSIVIREKIWDWWTTTALTRLEPNASVVVVMTRWHEDDLVGRILDNSDARLWDKIDFPAIAEEADVLGRSPGDALWPERYDVAALAGIRESVGSRAWNALYQQRPSAMDGDIFRRQWFSYWTRSGEHLIVNGRPVSLDECWCFITADLAMSTKTTADFTAIAVWLVAPMGELVLYDMVRRRMEAPAVEDELWRLYRQYKPRWVGIEKATYGMALLQKLRIDSMSVRELIPDKDKVTRASMASVMFENKRVWIPSEARWVADYESELLAFPNGSHDDMVDVTSYAALQHSNGPQKIKVERTFNVA
jgi:predicted phage terminase large subunit-like protein